MPAAVADFLNGQRHEAWTAYQARLTDADDQSLIIYAEDKKATLVTTNRDCALMARRMRSASVVWLSVKEVDAQVGMSTPIGPTVIIRTGPTSPDTPVQVCLLICGDGQPSPS